jgi:hypothetical protein
MTPNRIHLVSNGSDIAKLEEGIWESAFCLIEEPIAKRLAERSILFHKTPGEPSFFGGIILGYRLEEARDGTRIAFKFRYFEDHRGISAGRGGWSRDMKVVLPRK